MAHTEDTMSGESRLDGMSCEALRSLAKKAEKLASDLEGKRPSYALALEAGVEDRSYDTVRCGLVPHYDGKASVVMADGSKWRCVGHGPRGTAAWVSKGGWIEMIPEVGS